MSYTDKKKITWLLGDTDLIFLCWKHISLVRFAHSLHILSTLEDKTCISAQPCNIPYVFNCWFDIVLELILFYCTSGHEKRFSRIRGSSFIVYHTPVNAKVLISDVLFQFENGGSIVVPWCIFPVGFTLKLLIVFPPLK